MENSIVLQSTKWSAVSEILTKLASPLVNIILARLLAPEIFGLVAAFTLVTTFAEVFTDAGFQKYLIQHEFKTAKDYEECVCVAFWSNLLISFLFWALIVAFRNTVAHIVGCEGYEIEIVVLSMQIPIFGISSVQLSLYRREFRFKELVPIRLATSFVPIIVTVPAALLFRNCWALIVGNLAKESVNAFLLTYKSSWKPRLYFSFDRLKSMFSDCAWLFADALMIWCTSYSGTLIVSNLLDARYLGLFRTGQTTITQYLQIVFAVTNPVIFSSLSRCQNNIEEANRVFISYLKYVSYFVLPIGMGIFIYRDFVTAVLLGPQWKESATIIACVGFTYPISLLTGQFNSNYFRSMGKPNIAMIVQSIYTVLLVGIYLFAVKQEFNTFCIIAGCAGWVYMLVSNIALITVFKFPYQKMLQGWLPAIIGSIVMGIISRILLVWFGGSNLLTVISCVLSAVVYFAVLLIIPQSKADARMILKKLKAKKQTV